MKTYLNGYWDAIPLFEDRSNFNPDLLKEDDYIKDTYRVPSYFNQGFGESVAPFFEYEEYPPEWKHTDDAWFRKEFSLDSKKKR